MPFSLTLQSKVVIYLNEAGFDEEDTFLHFKITLL